MNEVLFVQIKGGWERGKETRKGVIIVCADNSRGDVLRTINLAKKVYPEHLSIIATFGGAYLLDGGGKGTPEQLYVLEQIEFAMRKFSPGDVVLFTHQGCGKIETQFKNEEEEKEFHILIHEIAKKEIKALFSSQLGFVHLYPEFRKGKIIINQLIGI